MSNPNDDAIPQPRAVAWDSEVLRRALPDCQPQEGSPANTFTDAEKQKLRPYLRPESADPTDAARRRLNQVDILEPWSVLEPKATPVILDAAEIDKRVRDDQQQWQQQEQENEQEQPQAGTDDGHLDWHGAPRFQYRNIHLPRAFRQRVREGLFRGPTNGVCPGFLQCNLVVLPQGKQAFDFLLFCQRNPKACPLIEVCEGPTSSFLPSGVAHGADLRTDVPKYAIYRNGILDREVTDATEFWPEDAVAFLIGCSFSYDGALMEAGIPLRSAEAGKNVPMFKTSLKCRPAGSLSGNIVVSMKPIPALQVAKHADITGRFPHAHGGPLCIGRPDVIGIRDMGKPDWGEAVDLGPEDVPVFHACGVTPQAVLMESQVPFAITHAAGHMFVTDLPSDMNI